MISYDNIKSQLTHSEIIQIIESICGPIEYSDFDTYMILPTICHNIEPQEANKKLYYYDNTRLFFCYTHCNSSFDIFELIKKMLELRGLDSSNWSILNKINEYVDFTAEDEENSKKYQSIANKYNRQMQKPELHYYSESILNYFQSIYPMEWIKDGLSIESMKKFGIKFSIQNDQAIIPHYNIDGNLIGIRARNFDPYLVASGNKYMPVKIEHNYYTHPLMYNLYGIWECAPAIKKFKVAWIFEGEKSSIICDGWYGNNNIAVASCGNKINKFQINILLSLGVKDIVICYDNMNYNNKTDEEYFNKLYSMCEKYKQYANFSFIFDRNHILPYKAAPVDCGRKIFEKLFNERVFV